MIITIFLINFQLRLIILEITLIEVCDDPNKTKIILQVLYSCTKIVKKRVFRNNLDNFLEKNYHHFHQYQIKMMLVQ